MTARLLFFGLVSAVCGFGAYTYDYSGAVPQYWTPRNGTVDAWTPAARFYTGGSLIWPTTVSGTNSNDYELNTTLALSADGGTYIHFLRASADAMDVRGTCSGSYTSVEIAPTSYLQGGGAPAQLNVNQCVSGTVTNLASQLVAIVNGSTMRSVVFGSNLWVYIDNQFVLAADVGTTTGQPGIGGFGMPSGSGFTTIAIGHHDTVAPNPIVSTGVRTSILPTQVSMMWQGTTDDPIGIGVSGYNVYRNTGGTWTYLGLRAGPSITDSSLAAGTSYTYLVTALDFHGNQSAGTEVNITTPPAGSVDPRRVGVFTTGSYWGGGGEQIDTLSGNLNFSLPLVTAQGRTGWTVPVGLSYNSQNWRQDNGVNWELGVDTGYGFGWSVQIGSITPYYAGWPGGVDHYVFTDGTGAQYRLDQNNGNVWSSLQGIYVWFDANANILHFKDGKIWVMGCVSGGEEQDAGTMYPTVIEDVNGNQVLVTYDGAPSLPAGSTNTSGRISTIWDVRSPLVCNAGCTTTSILPTYSFFYDTINPAAPLGSAENPTIPHLGEIISYFSTTESYGFTYNLAAALGPPFGATDPTYSGVTAGQLTGIAVPGTGAYAMIYDTAGANELQQVTFPWGGYLGWSYTTANYAGDRSLREISERYLNTSSSPTPATQWTYPITHSDSGGTIATVHADTTLADASGVGSKTWTFNTSGSWAGLAAQFTQNAGATSGSAVLTSDTYTWTQTTASGHTGSPYISQDVSVADGVSSKTTTQVLDDYGNVATSVMYPYGSTTTALQTYNNTYLSSSGYVSNYIFNRLLTTTLTTSSGTKTLVTNYYDSATLPTGNPCTSVSFPGGGSSTTREYDPTPPVASGQRGTLILTVTAAKSTCMQYDAYGNVARTEGSDGSTTTSTAPPSMNYATATSITTESYSYAIGYNSWLGVTQTAGANGEQMYTTYDSYGRPATATSPYGDPSNPTVTYAYSYAVPAWQTKTGPDGYTKTTLDGLGRPIEVDRGGPVDSTVLTIYAPCACSPLGKIQKTSQPYAASGSWPYEPTSSTTWTTYTYEGIGRTLAVQQPDGVSTTTYAYAGSQTTVTDPAGNQKTFTKDVLGNLLTVVEPNPAGGTLTTTYTYDWMNHLNTSTMTRAGVTQTRTFVYNDAGELTSATNPENGTVTYTYNSTGTLQKKVDAKGQAAVYTYDSSNRVTEEQWYPTGTSGAADPCRQVAYAYGTDATQYNYGRLVSSTYGSWNGPYYDANGLSGTCVPGANATIYTETYQYNAAGGVTNKTLGLSRRNLDSDGNVVTNSGSTGVSYAYGSWGQLASTSYGFLYPANMMEYLFGNGGAPPPVTFTYGYDSMGRPISLTDNLSYVPPYGDVSQSNTTVTGNNTNWVSGVTYDYAGRLSSWQRYISTTSYDCNWDDAVNNSVTESMTYNANGQLASKNFVSSQGSCRTTTRQNNGFVYTYPAANNGQISQVVDTVSGETIGYMYDALKRLTQASSTPNSGSTPAAWVQNYTYDGFGNMTAMALNGVTETAYTVDATTNRFTSSYDANGNSLSANGATLTYDEANRVASASPTSGGTEYYGYGPDNKRIYRLEHNGVEEWTLYGARGERLGTFLWVDMYGRGDCLCAMMPAASDLWFAGRLVWDGRSPYYTSYVPGGAPYQDRVGTNRADGARFYPYGGQIGGDVTPDDHEKFATYNRDSFTLLDYADQRYYASSYGRFNTVDPYGKSANPRNPGSWNRYSYALGDPVNGNDPRGLCVTDSQGEYWDTGDDDWGPGDCDQNPEWVSMANGAAPGTVVLNGGNYLGVSAAPDPVPCVSSSGAVVNCDDDSGDGGSTGNLEFINGVANGTGGFNSFLGGFAGGSVAVGGLGVGGVALAPHLAPLLPRLIAATARAVAAPVIGGNVVLLGTTADGYINLGGIVGAQTFSVPRAVWDLLSGPSKWAANQAFLDAAIANNSVIVLGSSAADAIEGSFFWQEIQYLTEKGYQLSADGTQMIHP